MFVDIAFTFTCTSLFSFFIYMYTFIYVVFKFTFKVLFPFLLKLYINKKFNKFNNNNESKNKKSSEKFDDFEEILSDQEFGVLVLTVLNNFKSDIILNDILDIIEKAIENKCNNE